MDIIKKYWKRILISLLSLMFLGMCTKNCSTNNDIRNLKLQYTQTDSIISVYKDSISELGIKNREINDTVKTLKNEISLYKKQIVDLNNAINRKFIINIKNDRYEE